MIAIHWVFYIVITVFMLYQIFRDRPGERGGYFSTAGLGSAVWTSILILFNLIWGGIFWW